MCVLLMHRCFNTLSTSFPGPGSRVRTAATERFVRLILFCTGNYISRALKSLGLFDITFHPDLQLQCWDLVVVVLHFFITFSPFSLVHVLCSFVFIVSCVPPLSRKLLEWLILWQCLCRYIFPWKGMRRLCKYINMYYLDYLDFRVILILYFSLSNQIFI